MQIELEMLVKQWLQRASWQHIGVQMFGCCAWSTLGRIAEHRCGASVCQHQPHLQRLTHRSLDASNSMKTAAQVVVSGDPSSVLEARVPCCSHAMPEPHYQQTVPLESQSVLFQMPVSQLAEVEEVSYVLHFPLKMYSVAYYYSCQI